MEPVRRIKEHIVALNSVSYDDAPGLDSFLSEIKETIREVFSEHSQYMTFLGSIYFRQVSLFVPPEESIRYWAKGKKQLRELLLVMLADPQLQVPEELVGVGAATLCEYELEEAERIVSRHIGDTELSLLPRIRIDLRDLNILDERVEGYLRHDRVLRQKAKTDRILFFSGRDEAFNNKVLEVLGRDQRDVVRVSYPLSSGGSLHEVFARNADVHRAVIVLGEDCRLSADFSSPSPASCFALGYLVSFLGRSRVVALYQENPSFRRPTDFFELFYIPVDQGSLWQREFLLRVRQNKPGI